MPLPRLPLLPTALAAPALLAAPAIAQLPIVVDDDPGVGVDFTSLQDAVDAAGAGDSILVKPGSYGPFTIDGKTVRLGADVPNTVTVAGTVVVRDVAAPDWVVLKGISIGGSEPLEIRDCSGAVQIESCSIAASGVALFQTMRALNIVDSGGVILSDCLVTGGAFASELDAGGEGLVATNSELSIYDSELFGGTVFDGIAGTPAARLVSCELFASGTSFRGGMGGPGDPGVPPFVGCSDGAPGGAALEASAGSATTFTLIDCELVGGPGGDPGGSACAAGPAGTTADLTSVALDQPAGITAREYDLTFPFVQGIPGEVVYRGEPGDLYWTFYSIGTDARPFPPILGTLTLADPLVIVYLGTLPASGEAILPVTVNLVTGKPFVAIHEQSVFFNLEDGFVFSTPRLAYVSSVGI